MGLTKVGNIVNQNPTRKNLLRNGDMTVWQRGSSFAVTTAATIRTADGWSAYVTDSGFQYDITRVALSAGEVENFQYCLKYTKTVKGSETNILLVQNFENPWVMENKKVTLSFWAKASSAADLPALWLQIALGTGGSGMSSDPQSLPTLTTSWQRFSVTYTVASFLGQTFGTPGTEKGSLSFYLPTSTAQGWYMQITGVQLEVGPSATEFDYRSPGEELAFCQRYFETSFPSGVTPAAGLTASTHGAVAWSSNNLVTVRYFKVRKRTTPTVTTYAPTQAGSGNQWAHFTGGAWVAITATTTNVSETDLSVNLTTTGLTQFYSYLSAGNWVADAEL
jgi:hypothetical protein